MKNDQLISFETAKLAKEKGFNLGTLYYFSNYGNILEKADHSGINSIYSIEGRINSHNSKWLYSYDAPTQSLLSKWLRNTYNIFIDIDIATDCELNVLLPFCYQFGIIDSYYKFYSTEYYNSYEEALEAGLKEALKLIKL